jgi:hypothetical protein
MISTRNDPSPGIDHDISRAAKAPLFIKSEGVKMGGLPNSNQPIKLAPVSRVSGITKVNASGYERIHTV